MRYFALFVILLSAMMVLMASLTPFFDVDYQEAIGLPWIMVAPIFKMLAVFSGFIITATIILANEFDKDIQKEKAFNNEKSTKQNS